MSHPHSLGSPVMTGSLAEFHSIPETCQSGLGETLGAQSLSSHLGCDHRGFFCFLYVRVCVFFLNTSSRAEELVRAQRFGDATVWDHNITVRSHSWEPRKFPGTLPDTDSNVLFGTQSFGAARS